MIEKPPLERRPKTARTGSRAGTRFRTRSVSSVASKTAQSEPSSVVRYVRTPRGVRQLARAVRQEKLRRLLIDEVALVVPVTEFIRAKQVRLVGTGGVEGDSPVTDLPADFDVAQHMQFLDKLQRGEITPQATDDAGYDDLLAQFS